MNTQTKLTLLLPILISENLVLFSKPTDLYAP